MVTSTADLANRLTQPLHFANRRYVKELSSYRKQRVIQLPCEQQHYKMFPKYPYTTGWVPTASLVSVARIDRDELY